MSGCPVVIAQSTGSLSQVSVLGSIPDGYQPFHFPLFSPQNLLIRIQTYPPPNLQIIHRTTLDHPYHCLYVILALSNASKDDKYPTSGHVTGTKLPREGGGGGGGRNRLARKNSTGTNHTVDEVSACSCIFRHTVSNLLHNSVFSSSCIVQLLHLVISCVLSNLLDKLVVSSVL